MSSMPPGDYILYKQVSHSPEKQPSVTYRMEDGSLKTGHKILLAEFPHPNTNTVPWWHTLGKISHFVCNNQ
jgi:hypothetical protein